MNTGLADGLVSSIQGAQAREQEAPREDGDVGEALAVDPIVCANARGRGRSQIENPNNGRVESCLAGGQAEPSQVVGEKRNMSIQVYNTLIQRYAHSSPSGTMRRFKNVINAKDLANQDLHNACRFMLSHRPPNAALERRRRQPMAASIPGDAETFRHGAYQVVYTAGFGLNDSACIPLRLPAFILPALHAMEQLVGVLEQPPRLVLYQATDFISQTNGISRAKAHQQASRMEKYLRAYIDNLHPSVCRQVSYHFRLGYSALEEETCKGLEDLLENALDGDEGEACRKALKLSEERHSRESGKSLRYAAANAYYSGAVPNHYPFLSSVVKEESQCSRLIILPVGGTAEKIFFGITRTLRKLMVEKTDSRERDVVQGIYPRITQIGGRPTYYAVRPVGKLSDPTTVEEMNDYLKDFRLGGEAKKRTLRDVALDLVAIDADGFCGQKMATILRAAEWEQV